MLRLGQTRGGGEGEGEGEGKGEGEEQVEKRDTRSKPSTPILLSSPRLPWSSSVQDRIGTKIIDATSLCRIQGLGFGFWGFGPELSVEGAGFGVWGSSDQGSRLWVWDVGLEVVGLGFNPWTKPASQLCPSRRQSLSRNT